MLESAQRVFIVGIKGVAMVNLARMLHQMGKLVSGSDTGESFTTDAVLQESNIECISSFSVESLPQNLDLVIYSAAHGGIHNAQVIEAQRRGVRVAHQIEVLQEMMKGFPTSVAVCGCHGKTTTSALMAHALKKLGAKPSYMVGASDFNGSFGGEYGASQYFVIEADEYGLNPPHDATPKLNYLHPTHVLATNIDFDHPDVYRDVVHTKEVFGRFFEKVTDSEKLEIRNSKLETNSKNQIQKEKMNQKNVRLYFCADDENLMEVAGKLPREAYLTYGFSEAADLQIIEMKSSEESTRLKMKDKRQHIEAQFELSLFGEKNILNAAGVILALLQFGFEVNKIQEAVKDFTGANRRFQKKAFVNNTYLFDDYAHHPHEIEATINAARNRFPTRRLVIIFQPHTFSRTESLKGEFVQALSKADISLLMPIFASAREDATKFSITSKQLEEIARAHGIHNIKGFHSKEEVVASISEVLKPGDVVFTMGAGNVYTLKDDIMRTLEGLETGN